jgi:hypothetical protein
VDNFYLVGNENVTIFVEQKQQIMAKKTDTLAATRLTKERVFEYWRDQEYGRRSPYIDDCNEYDTTAMGEDAATYFCVATDNGDSQIEQSIFDWAVDYAK